MISIVGNAVTFNSLTRPGSARWSIAKGTNPPAISAATPGLANVTLRIREQCLQEGLVMNTSRG
jgi:hypothetical protein